MMKTVALLASLVASASAFVPAAPQQSSASTALNAKADYVNDIGVTAPLGVFDPFAKLDKIDSTEFNRLRALELKHGRVAMLGVVGYLTTYAGVRLPGLEDVPCGWAAWEALPGDVSIQMGATWIFMEMANRDQTGGNAEFVGDFRNGYLDFGWDSQTAEWKTKKRTIELNQGRAAQMGVLGLMVHDAMGNVQDILP
ncbi:Fucoxanthin-chlorophyll a-c binding protein [Seminavis robusta]|uniref:Fucoxanthin-chlorophyll a-c binding protein n=1 Tax=Seminavis robusta TaxID=568900 RepID=A0A9N8E959_9STRA|nr:Fucoxanthin-chlorophyll a-c binding protein [Seminavis robusta]|eukprot:Sro823_g207590.1 Fucoxanthin-chlorophyll a-c binding protein (197) ;mRNA; f:31252-31842